MRTRQWSVLLGILWLLTACAALPTGPQVLVVPRAGTSLEVFQQDDRECQDYAGRQLPTGAQARAVSAAMLQWRYDLAYVQCMYAKGHQVPGGALSPPSQPTVPPAAPPGPPRA